MPQIEITRSLTLRRSQRWRWRLRARNGHIIAEAGEGYSDKAVAIAMATKIVINGAYADAAVVG